MIVVIGRGPGGACFCEALDAGDVLLVRWVSSDTGTTLLTHDHENQSAARDTRRCPRDLWCLRCFRDPWCFRDPGAFGIRGVRGELRFPDPWCFRDPWRPR